MFSSISRLVGQISNVKHIHLENYLKKYICCFLYVGGETSCTFKKSMQFQEAQNFIIINDRLMISDLVSRRPSKLWHVHVCVCLFLPGSPVPRSWESNAVRVNKHSWGHAGGGIYRIYAGMHGWIKSYFTEHNKEAYIIKKTLLKTDSFVLIITDKYRQNSFISIPDWLYFC